MLSSKPSILDSGSKDAADEDGASPARTVQDYAKECEQQKDQISQLLKALNSINEDHEKLLKKYERISGKKKDQTPDHSPLATPSEELRKQAQKPIRSQKFQLAIGSLFRRSSRKTLLKPDGVSQVAHSDSVSETHEKSNTLGVNMGQSEEPSSELPTKELGDYPHDSTLSNWQSSMGENLKTDLADNSIITDNVSFNENINDLQKRLEDQQSLVKQKDSKIKKLTTEITSLQSENSKLLFENREFRSKLSIRNKELKDIAHERNKLRRELRSHRSESQNGTEDAASVSPSPSISHSNSIEPFSHNSQSGSVNRYSVANTSTDSVNHRASPYSVSRTNTFMTRIKSMGTSHLQFPSKSSAHFSSKEAEMARINKIESLKKLANSLMKTINEKDHIIETLQLQCTGLKNKLKKVASDKS